MEHRYFRVSDGPVWDRFLALRTERIAAEKVVRAFIKSIGADNCYGRDPNSYAFSFPKEKREAIRKSAMWVAHPRIGGAYYPSKRLAAARELREQVKALPPFPDINEALREVGLYHGFPALIEGNHGHSPWIRFFSVDDRIIVIAVPWRLVNPKDMAKYQRERKAGKHMSAEMDYLAWEPAESLHEMKEWEALKLIDDLTPAKESQ